ncbi:MAG: type II toxin-antitoxin system HicB family antitoxin [Oscillospiraceae bacterium]|nr:type II toxin-antitoxin system HicB family antitoxin [Oscillospiraceae bacterium]
MKSTMSYKDYHGSVEFSDEDNVFFGRIIGINDRITFEGDNVKNLRKDFQEAVDEYLEICMQMGKEPEKEYKGTFNVRIAPALHKELAIYSFSQGRTLNSVVEEAIKGYIK